MINAYRFIGTHVGNHLIYKIQKPCKSDNTTGCVLVLLSLFIDSIYYSTCLFFDSPEPDRCQFIFFSASITSFYLHPPKSVLGVSHRRDLPSRSPHPASPVFDFVHVLTSESHRKWRMTLQHPNSLYVTNDLDHTEQLCYFVKHLQYHIQLVWR